MIKLISGLLLGFFAAAVLSEEPRETWSSGPAVPAGFYASSFAYDAKRARYFVGSYQNGEVLVLDSRGQFLQRIRSSETRRIRQLRFDARDQSLWVVSNRGIEQYAADALPSIRMLNRWSFSSVADIAVRDAKTLVALDAVKGELFQIDRRSGATRSLVSFFHEGRAVCAHNGALLVRTDEGDAFVALGDALWRVDLRSGDKHRVDLPLRNVSQLVALDSGRVLAMQGEVNHAVLLHLDDGGRVNVVERLGLQATQALYAGGVIHVLDGSLRHHTDFCGDGRPNVNTRLRSVALRMPMLELAHRANRGD